MNVKDFNIVGTVKIAKRVLGKMGLLLIAVIAILILVGAQDCCIPTPKPVHILGFVEQGTSRIRVRYCTVGESQWKDGEFQNETTETGVGLATLASGWFNVAFYTDSSDRLQAIWGVGVAAWGSRPAGLPLNERAYCSPSADLADTNIYIVAFRTSSDTVSVRALDTDNSKWIGTSLAPAHALNSDVVGVSITRMGSKVLLSWRRKPGDFYDIVTALGDITIVDVGGQDTPVINWTRVSTFTLTESEYGRPLSDPAVTHDNTNFYLAFVRRTSSGQLRHDGLFVYSSDGTSWNHYASKVGIPLGATVTLTAYGTGDLLAAVVGSSADHLGVYQRSGSSWTELNADSVFHWTPKPFTGLSLVTTIRD